MIKSFFRENLDEFIDHAKIIFSIIYFKVIENKTSYFIHIIVDFLIKTLY